MAELFETLRADLTEIFVSRFVRHTFALQVGTFLSTGLAFVTSVVLARVLNPEGYGIYGLVFSLLGLVNLVGDLGIGQTTIVRFAEAYARRDRMEVQEILTFFVVASSLLYGSILVIGVLMAPLLGHLLYGHAEYGELARVLFLMAPMGIVYGLIGMIMQGIRLIESYVVIEGMSSILKALVIISFAVSGFGVAGVTWGYVTGTLLSSIAALIYYLWIRGRSEKEMPAPWEILFRQSRSVLRKHLPLSISISVDSNLVHLMSMLPIVFLGMFSSPANVSYYKIAVGAIAVPLAFLGPISRNLTLKLAENMGTRDLTGLRRNFFKVSLYSGLLSTAGILGFAFLAPSIIAIFYGEGYLPAVPVIFILAVPSGLLGFGVGIGPVFRILNRMDYPIKINLVLFAIMLPLGVLLIPLFEQLGAAGLISTRYVIATFASLYFIGRLFRRWIATGNLPISTV